MLDEDKTFVVQETGETTDRQFIGTFTVKRTLSKRDDQLADQRRRLILGPQPENATISAANDAYVLGQLSVRITKSPAWWDESDGGLDLKDNNIIAKIYSEAVQAELEWRNEIDKRAEEAGKTVKKIADKAVESEAAKE